MENARPRLAPPARPPTYPGPDPRGGGEEMAVVLAWLNARVVDPLLQVIQR